MATDLSTIPPANARTNPYVMLGHSVKGLANASDMLATCGADFTAYGQLSHAQALDGPNGTPGSWVPDGGLSVFRDDTHEVIGKHKDGYVIVQYAEILALALDAAQLAKGSVSSVGTTDNGGRFYATIDLDDMYLDPKGINDRIFRYLVLFSSHNGTVSIAFLPSMIRDACTNQIPAAFARDRQGFAAKHTKNVSEKLALVKGALGLAEHARQVFEEQAEKLLALPSTTVSLNRTIEKMWPTAPGDGDKKKTQTENRIARIQSIYASDTCAGGVGHNMWAQYNAITEYLDHGRGTNADKRALATITPGTHVEKAKVAALNLCLN